MIRERFHGCKREKEREEARDRRNGLLGAFINDGYSEEKERELELGIQN